MFGVWAMSYDDWKLATPPEYDEMDDQDECCPNCGGEGVVYSCFEEWACVDPEGGCDLCEQRCDWCNRRTSSGLAHTRGVER